MLVPIGTALLFRAYPQEERAAASRVLIIPSVLAPAIGPVLGGLLVDDLSWRWTFVVNVPIGLAALLFGMLFLHSNDEVRAGAFDLPGFMCAAVGFATLLYGLSVGPSHGWGAPEASGALLVAAVLVAVLVRTELRREQPLVDIRRFGDRAFRRASAIAPFSTGAFLGTLYLVPQLLQIGRGQSALQSGLTTFPEALGVIVCSQISGRAYPRVGPRRLLAGGLLGVALTVTGIALLPGGASLWNYRGLMLLLGCAMGFVFLPIQIATFAQVSHEETGRASSLFNAIRQLSAALGVAVLASVVGRDPHGLVRFRYALVTAAGLSLAGALFSLRFKDSDAASTLNQSTERVPEIAPLSAG